MLFLLLSVSQEPADKGLFSSASVVRLASPVDRVPRPDGVLGKRWQVSHSTTLRCGQCYSHRYFDCDVGADAEMKPWPQQHLAGLRYVAPSSPDRYLNTTKIHPAIRTAQVFSNQTTYPATNGIVVSDKPKSRREDPAARRRRRRRRRLKGSRRRESR